MVGWLGWSGWLAGSEAGYLNLGLVTEAGWLLKRAGYLNLVGYLKLVT